MKHIIELLLVVNGRSLVEEHDVGAPDVARANANHSNATVTRRLPSQLDVLPTLNAQEACNRIEI